MEVSIKPVGDQAVLAVFEQRIAEDVSRKVMALRDALLPLQGEGILETVPAFASLLVYYDPLRLDYRTVERRVKDLAGNMTGKGHAKGKTVEIPVCYGGKYGEDLEFVADHAGLSKEEVIRLHSGRTYRIYMLGFLPGFPYLGGLDERLFTPRLASPRTKIPAGSVGIGGEQTGIYPMESPGGWRLIGRTPLVLYDPADSGRPAYEAGDTIRFVPVGEAEYERRYGERL